MLEWNFRSFVSGHDQKRDPGREKSRRRLGPSPLADFIWLLAVVAVLTPPAYCRDDRRETYPNEITVSELERYGRWLNLSESQQVAARAMHQAYLEKFATLNSEEIVPHSWPIRDGETIAEFFELADAYWDGTEVIRTKIRRVDGALLDEIMGILDDSQLPALQRVRDCRAIQTLRVTQMINVTQRPFHDVTKFAYDLELSEADAALLDPILIVYERRLLNLSRPLHEKAFKQETELTREFIRRGFGDEKKSRSFPDEWEATVRDVWLDKGPQIMDLIFDIDKLNETTTRRIEQTLSHEAVQAWLDEYMTRSYQHADEPRKKRRLLMKSIDQAGPLSDRDETIFGELLLGFDVSLRRLERRMIELDLKGWPREKILSIKDLRLRGQNNKYRDDLDEASKELDTLVDRFLLQLEQSLSPDGFAKWDVAYGVATERKSTFTRPTHSDGRTIQSVRWASIFFQPRDLRRFTRLFGLNDEKQAVLQEAFRAYGKRKTALESDLPQRIRIRYSWQPPLPVNLRDRLRQSDEIFLSALARQLENESDERKVDWLRNARRRNRLGYRISARGAAGGLDLVLFILDSDLAAEEINTLYPLIEEYDARAVGLYERQLTTYTTHYDWVIDNQDDESRVFPHLHVWWEAQSAIAKLNADTMFVIGEQLESEASAAMIELFKRYCYGPLFNDP